MRANKVSRSPSLRTMMTRLCTCFFSLFIHCAFIPHFFRLLPCFCLAFALLYTTIEFTLTLTYTLLFCLNVDYTGMILSRVSLSQPSRSIDLSIICAIGFGAYVLPLICMLTCVSSLLPALTTLSARPRMITHRNFEEPSLESSGRACKARGGASEGLARDEAQTGRGRPGLIHWHLLVLILARMFSYNLYAPAHPIAIFLLSIFTRTRTRIRTHVPAHGAVPRPSPHSFL